jgi:pimeloyl-ACP methyl ester carboxylesterase
LNDFPDDQIESGETKTKTLGQRIFRLVRSGALIAGMAYLAMIAFLAYFENSLVYPGSKYPRGNWVPEKLGYAEIEFEAADGIKLFGWYLPCSSDQTDGDGADQDVATHVGTQTILHCHGNGENIAQVGAYTAKRFSETLRGSIFIFDYRGFGKSAGSASEIGIRLDAEAALQWVCKKDDCQPEDVILVGHSLGGGPACYLAEKYGCKCLILQRTFSSLPEAAAYKYPMFPVSWIMKNRMNSAEAIKSCDMPLFQSHGDQDELIPIALAKKLFANSPVDEKQFFEVEGMGHFDHLPERYWGELRSFVESACK